VFDEDPHAAPTMIIDIGRMRQRRRGWRPVFDEDLHAAPTMIIDIGRMRQRRRG
jgi:hypothetical protein